MGVVSVGLTEKVGRSHVDLWGRAFQAECIAGAKALGPERTSCV